MVVWAVVATRAEGACPGGSLTACIALCPLPTGPDDAAKYQACCQDCVDNRGWPVARSSTSTSAHTRAHASALATDNAEPDANTRPGAASTTRAVPR